MHAHRALLAPYRPLRLKCPRATKGFSRTRNHDLHRQPCITGRSPAPLWLGASGVDGYQDPLRTHGLGLRPTPFVVSKGVEPGSEQTPSTNCTINRAFLEVE